MAALYPVKATDIRVREALGRLSAEYKRLPTLLELRSDLKCGSFDRLQRFRVAYALEHGMQDQVRGTRLKTIAHSAPLISEDLRRLLKLLDAVSNRLERSPALGLNSEGLEPLLNKALREPLNNIALQTNLALNDLRRDLSRRLDHLERSVNHRPHWRNEVQAAVLDAMSGMGLTQVIAPAIDRLRKAGGIRRRDRAKGHRKRLPKKIAKPAAPPKPDRAPGKRAHPMEKLGYKRFLAGTQRQRVKLLKEAAGQISGGGDLNVGSALLRGCIKAAGGFERVAKILHIRVSRLRQAFGPKGEPTAPELAATLAWLTSGYRV